MTPQERDVLLPLLDKIRQTTLPEKDAEAGQYIHQLLQAQPDAPYIMAQTILMQDYSLHQAQARIQALEAQGSQTQPSGGGSFLGGLFGGGNRAPAPAPWGAAPQSPYAQPMTNAVQSGGQPSFLRSAAQTAMGIAGGALLFQGVESLFGGHGGFGGGFGGGMMGGGGNTEVVNNYYDTTAPDQSAGVDNSDYSNADFDTSGGDFSGDDSFGI